MNLSVYSIIYVIIRIKIFEYKNKYPGMIISADIPEDISEDGNLEEIIEKYKLYIDKCNKILKKIHFMEIDYNNAYNNTTELLYFLNIIIEINIEIKYIILDHYYMKEQIIIWIFIIIIIQN